MVTSLISLATDSAVPPNIAMTGEITLTGKVLRIGGVKEKAMAAKRSGASVIILPKENEADFCELPNYVSEGLEVHFASDFADVAEVALPALAKRKKTAKAKLQNQAES
jgi:Lon-like ATP-dependent protease